MARFPFRIGYCGKPARHTGVLHLLRLLVMQTCLCLSYHMAPTAVNISPVSYLYRFTRSCYVFFALAEKPPPPSRESRWDPPRSFMVSPNGQPPGGALATYQLQFCSKHGFGSHISPPGQRRRFHCFGNTFFCKKMTADGPKCRDQHPEMRRSAAPAPFFDIKTSSLLLTSRRDDVIMFFMK